MTIRYLTAIGCFLALSAVPARAQDANPAVDPAAGIEAISILEGGAVLIRNGDNVFSCALTATQTAAELSDCQFRVSTSSEAGIILSAMTDPEWQALVRQSFLDADCKLSAFRGVGDVLATLGRAEGMTPEAIEVQRAELATRAEAAMAAMVREGTVSYRDGELALDDCS